MARRATSLGPKPSLFVFVVFLFRFLFFGFFNTKKNLVFPLEKGIFCWFSVFVFLSPLAFFGLPLFLFLFLCLSLFFFFFLYSFLSFFLAFFWFLVFVSFFRFLSSLLFFMKGTTSKYSIASFLLINIFSFFGFLSLFVSSSFFLCWLFPDFRLCFLFNIKVFGFKTNNLKKKNRNFWSKGGLQQNGFFISTCVLQNVKSYRFWGFLFCANFGWCSKNTIKIVFPHIFKSKTLKKKWPFLVVTNWATLIVTKWATFVPL